MKITSIIRVVLTVVLFTMSSVVTAQSSRGDKLFIEGQQHQQTLTIESQDLAIKKFKQAKNAYTTQDKKDMCDNQISICEQNKTRIKQDAKKKQRSRKSGNAGYEEGSRAQNEGTQAPVRTDAQISFSKSRLDFVAKPNPNKMQTVKVQCNYDDWTLDETPEWVQVISQDRKTLYIAVIEDNNTNEARSCTIIARIDDKIATLTINQKKKRVWDKARDIVE